VQRILALSVLLFTVFASTLQAAEVKIFLGDQRETTLAGTLDAVAVDELGDVWTESYNIARIRMFYAAYNEVSIPPYNNTFSSATLTRGLWLTAPRNFTITGLQVPDEAAHGLQNLEVVLFGHGGTPPTYPTTTEDLSSLFRVTGVSSSQVVEVSIPVQIGQTIGILGAAGDASMMHNSYGTTTTWASDIFGTPMTVYRLGMQYNLVTTPARSLFTSSGSVSRVRIFYDE
jgi:hypothetical protein